MNWKLCHFPPSSLFWAPNHCHEIWLCQSFPFNFTYFRICFLGFSWDSESSLTWQILADQLSASHRYFWPNANHHFLFLSLQCAFPPSIAVKNLPWVKQILETSTSTWSFTPPTRPCASLICSVWFYNLKIFLFPYSPFFLSARLSILVYDGSSLSSFQWEVAVLADLW